MKRQNGGYLIIDLSSTTLVGDLAKAYANDKPVLVYGEDGKATWCVIKENEGAYTLINPDVTYSITSEGVITSVPTVSTAKKLYIHFIRIYCTSGIGVTLRRPCVTFSIISEDSSAYTFANLLTVIKKIGRVSASGFVFPSIDGTTHTNKLSVVSVGVSGTTNLIFDAADFETGSFTTEYLLNVIPSGMQYQDLVSEIKEEL